MARRQSHQAEPGQPFASEWPEWHVDCAAEDCQETVVMAGCGEAFTIREAERLFRKKASGWVKRDGRWYCPDHDPKGGA